MILPVRPDLVKPLAFLVLLFTLLAPLARAQDRWALVLAVGEYADPAIPDLANTINDGRTMASVLNQMGFRVYYAENAGKAEFEDLLAQVVEEQAGAELGMFFFAGHGLQVAGENLALPADMSADLGTSL